MSELWIKYTKALPRCPEVFRLMALTGMPRGDVLYSLLELWSWADGQTADGNLPGIGMPDLWTIFPQDVSLPHCSREDLFARFATALTAVGWLKVDHAGARLPAFDKHMGRSEKARAQAARRQAAYRDRHSVTKVTHGVTVERYTPGDSPQQAPPTHATGPAQTHAGACSDNPSETPGNPCQPDNRPGVTVERYESDAPRNARPLPDKRREDNNPPTPLQGGASAEPGANKQAPREPVRCVADDPELAAVARKLVGYYRDKVGSAVPPGGAVVAVMNHLIAGRSEADVRHAIDGYAANCAQRHSPPDKRQGAGTFFGPSGHFAAFADGDDPTPEKYTPAPKVKPLPKRTPPANPPARPQGAR